MVKLCHLAGIVKPCGHGRKLTLRPGAAAIALTLTLTLTLTRYGDGGRGGSRPGVGVLGGNPRPGGPSPVNPRPGGLSPSSKTMPMTMTMPAPMTTMTMTMPMRSSSSSSSSRPRRSSSSSCSSSSSRGAAARQQQQRAAAGAAAATTALRALSCCRVCHRVCGGDRWSPMPRGLCHRSNYLISFTRYSPLPGVLPAALTVSHARNVRSPSSRAPGCSPSSRATRSSTNHSRGIRCRCYRHAHSNEYSRRGESAGGGGARVA